MTMRRDTTERLIVLAVSFVLFVIGVSALSMDRGGGRTILLACSITGLVAVAAGQTVRRMKKKEK